MKWLILLLWFSFLGSCCPKYSSMPQEKFSEKEVILLANNCEYVELICSERMVKINEKNDYKFDSKIVSILNKTNCFMGLTPSDLYTLVGKPTKITDLFVSYYFRTESESRKFTLLNFRLENGIIVGQGLITGGIEH